MTRRGCPLIIEWAALSSGKRVIFGQDATPPGHAPEERRRGATRPAFSLDRGPPPPPPGPGRKVHSFRLLCFPPKFHCVRDQSRRESLRALMRARSPGSDGRRRRVSVVRRALLPLLSRRKQKKLFFFNSIHNFPLLFI